MENPEEYYDMDEDYDEDEQSSKKIVYPPRLMVDFTNLGMHALLRYAQFYHVHVRDDCEKDELAAAVARHFDGSLEVEEDESIVSFMQRIRNGEKGTVRHRVPEKDRKLDKKRKQKSSSRKRQRDLSMGTSNLNGSSGSLYDREGKGGREGTKDSSSTRLSGPPSSKSGSTTGSNSSKKSQKKEKTTRGEDNELYCVCNLPSYGNMIACDGKKCPNPSQWYHLECVGFSDGHHPDTWLCPECDPKGFQEFKNKKKRTGSSSSSSGTNGTSKGRSKSPGTK